ncbi:MAG: YlxR family protein [Myxococcales bacterium]|nr:YlxR family protein [Myxococcales bacterium]
MRTCVGCRTVKPQAELLRTRCPGGRVTPAGKTPAGRSAYVCPLRACIELAVRKGGFRRSFRNNAIADTDGLWAALADSRSHKLHHGPQGDDPKATSTHPSGRNA